MLPMLVNGITVHMGVQATAPSLSRQLISLRQQLLHGMAGVQGTIPRSLSVYAGMCNAAGTTADQATIRSMSATLIMQPSTLQCIPSSDNHPTLHAYQLQRWLALRCLPGLMGHGMRAEQCSQLNAPPTIVMPFSHGVSRSMSVTTQLPHSLPRDRGNDSSSAMLANNLFDDEQRAQLTPSAIVGLLDDYIVGQRDAKRAVAIALRNRWRRLKIPSPMKEEVMPKNILMIGPTGCGKTEIARRLAKLADSPFIKVEATKYTELGYVGRDVDDIVKDLVENAISLVRTRLRQRLLLHTQEKVENVILESLLGAHADKDTWETFRQAYRIGQLDERTVEIELPAVNISSIKFDNGIIMLDKLFGGGAQGMGPRRLDKKKMKVGEAKAQIAEGEVERFLQGDTVVKEAVRATEQHGIVFIDEIDKIVEPSGRSVRSSVSSEGVQRDLLPIIEGSVVSTKFGNVSTEHILFICSGAFHSCKPSDLLAELQGRLPIRVELKGLTADDFYHILTEPQNNMIKQHQALLLTEGVELTFTQSALRTTARMAEQANRLLDNIGARRLHTVLERILAEVSYAASERVEAARKAGQSTCKFQVDKAYVTERMGDLLKTQDLSKFVL